MITLTERQKEIIKYLLNSDDFMSINKVSEHLDVSERTVRYDLDIIEEYLKKLYCNMLRKQRLGILLQCDGVIKENILKSLMDFSSRVFPHKERVFLIIIYILSKDSIMTIQKLSDLLSVSKNTIVADFCNVEKRLEIYGLYFNKKTYHGLEICGEEECIRNSFYEIFIEGVNNFIIDRSFFRVFYKNREDILEVQNIISHIEKDMGICYSDSSKEELEICMLYTIHRAANNKHIYYSKELIQKHTAKDEFKILKDFFSESTYQDKIHESDLYYLTKRFLGAKIMYFVEKTDVSEEAKEAGILAREVIQESEEYLGIDFSNDYEFINSFTVHLKVALYRLRNNLTIENILTEQIKYRYTFIYEITKKILSKHEHQIKCSFPDNEIAYVAMYIGAAFERNAQSGFMPKVLVICGSGMATSGILSTRLKIMIPELRIIGPVAINDIESKLTEQKIDFVISTVKIEIPSYQVVKVNPLLDVEDISNIKNLIFKNTYKKQSDYLAKRCEIKYKNRAYLKDIIHEENTSFKVKTTDWREAIRIAAKPLIGKNMIKSSYTQAMIKAVETLGPYMVFIPGIAFTHASPDDGVLGEGISLITLENEINFGDTGKEKASVIMVFATTSNKSNILTRLISILENENNIEKIKSAKCYKDIVLLNS